MDFKTNDKEYTLVHTLLERPSAKVVPNRANI